MSYRTRLLTLLRGFYRLFGCISNILAGLFHISGGSLREITQAAPGIFDL